MYLGKVVERDSNDTLQLCDERGRTFQTKPSAGFDLIAGSEIFDVYVGSYGRFDDGCAVHTIHASYSNR